MFKNFFVLTLIAFAISSRAAYGDPGILLLAHGGNAEWNARVTALAADVDRARPTEVAFGMATRATIQTAIDRLVARRVTEIVAVPLFVSSWSSIVTSTEYLLGLRAEAPPALARYAGMNHAPQGSRGGADHADHAAVGGTRPVVSPVPIRMTPALNDHPIVADILASRARAISRNPGNEALIIVAHGPNGDEDNRRWLVDMESLAARLRKTEPYESVDYLTLRDDAPKPIRDRATADLRALVETRSQEGRQVLIVPLLVSFGGIERGLRDRLQGLTYRMADSGLVPDERLVSWVLAMADAH